VGAVVTARETESAVRAAVLLLTVALVLIGALV
jgi:hypothetical protein